MQSGLLACFTCPYVYYCSRHFYGGKLQDGVSAAAKPAAAGVAWPVYDQPVMVVGLRGLEEKAQKSGEKVRTWHVSAAHQRV